MAKNKGFTAAYEALPKLAKIIIQILLGAIVGGVYRIVRFFETGNVVTLIAGLICTFTGIGNVVGWVVDLVTEIMFDRITIFAD